MRIAPDIDISSGRIDRNDGFGHAKRCAHPDGHNAIETPNERYLPRCTSVVQLRHPENFFSFLRLPSHGRKLLPPRFIISLVFFFPLKSPHTIIEKSHGGQMSSNLQILTVPW
jgi:hypothetical protein